MPYFIDNREHFKLEPGANGLRGCQLGCIYALKSHYTAESNSTAALVSMPTGSGKTAAMMAAAFEMGVRKLLIVVPSKALRSQLCRQFRSLQILKDQGCLAAASGEVSVKEITKRIRSVADWTEILNDHDVIIAHPNSVSPHFLGELLTPVPANLIDAVFIDEAHHEPAKTWQAINSEYSGLKRVFFTATPFRRDKRKMKAKLVYHYPIGRALDDGVMREVRFEPIAAGLQDEAMHEALRARAIEVFNEELEANADASILVRTNTIEQANALAAQYVADGVDVRALHSDNTKTVNDEILTEVRSGDIAGIVAVDSVSEGIDVPNLKVAVLHSTPRSIPYTIQLLGRIARANQNQEGPAILVANTDEVRGEVSRLYKTDQDWARVIPGIVDAQMQQVVRYSANEVSIEGFSLPELKLYYSVKVHEVVGEDEFSVGLEDDVDLDDVLISVLHVEQDNANSPLVVITKHDMPIPWSDGKLSQEDLLHVHVLYYHPQAKLLFELTTSDYAFVRIKAHFRDRTRLRTIKHNRLHKVLHQASTNNYLMVGLRNAVHTGLSHPSYKTMVGTSVESSVLNSEGRVFSVGHAVKTIGRKNTWGVAVKNGRVWSMKRGSIGQFQDWCDSIAGLIHNGAPEFGLPGLDFMAKSEAIQAVPESPLTIVPDDMFFKCHEITIQPEGEAPIRQLEPIFENIDTEHGALTCVLRLDAFTANVTVDLTRENIWEIEDGENIAVHATRFEGDVVDSNLQAVLNDYPPALLMKNGTVIIGSNLITPNNVIESVPDDLWLAKIWTNTDITSEAYNHAAAANNLPVINKVVEMRNAQLNLASDVMVLDDGAHEIADLIEFDVVRKTVSFIHCKFSSRNFTGCRKNDADELFSQAMRSINWIYNPELFSRIYHRLDGNSQLLIGDRPRLEGIEANFNFGEWRFKIVMAQPGFRHGQVSDRNRANNNVYEMAIPTYERIVSCNAKAEIWTSPDP